MIEFILPDIGEGIVECELLEWLVKEGDIIVEDQAVAEVMTDKATVQIPAMHNGTVKKLHYKEGDIAKVHSPLFAMEASDEAIDESTKTDESLQQLPTFEPAVDVQDAQLESFILPDIGEGIVECEIVKWCVAVGDEVLEDQVVVEVMTDKAVVEIPAKFSGKVVALHYQQGDIAKVHTPLFEQSIVHADSATGTHSHAANTATQQHANSVETQSGMNVVVNNGVSSSVQKTVGTEQGGMFEAPVAIDNKVLASPAIRRIARENKIDLASVNGTGKKGRILKQDVMAALTPVTESVASLNSNNSEHQNPSARIENNKITFEANSDVTVVPLKGMRAAMAKQMLASVSTIPHFTVSDELCMDNLIKLRTQLKPDFEKRGLKLSYMPFFIKSLSLALHDFKEINAHFNDQLNELHVHHSHNIGLAVDSKLGLLVPNIKNVQDKSLLEVTVELNRIIDLARDGKLSSADLKGGTISISNIGALGGTIATPVINKPELAIVALGKTQVLPRFDELGELVASNIMTLNWSGDHRVIDGATMVRFNNLWMSYLNSPEKMLVQLK